MELLSLTEMNKCQHCGTFVPVEKAFCPNCSEPIEPEEAPNRATSSSSDMMATMRDDPDNYKELLLSLKKGQQVNVGADIPIQSPPPATPVFESRIPPRVPETFKPEGNKRNVTIVLSIVSLLILVLVLLLVFKII